MSERRELDMLVEWLGRSAVVSEVTEMCRVPRRMEDHDTVGVSGRERTLWMGVWE
jgi:hypothetical protein